MLVLLSGIVFAQTRVNDAGLPELSLPILIGLAIIDSINPCVIGVLILMITMLLKLGDKKAILVNGLVYCVGVYTTYLIGGVTLLGVFNAIRDIALISQAMYGVIGVFVLFAGILEVKDYFWYGRWYSLAIPHFLTDFVEKKAAGTRMGLGATFSAGVLLTLVELPCTGAPYLAVLTLMAQGGYNYITALPLLLLYNFVFVLPLLIIIGLAYSGASTKSMEGWRQEHRGIMRLLIGLALLAIGIWIITAVAEYLLWPLILGLLGLIALMGVLKYVIHF